MPGIKSALSYYNRIMASSDPTPQKRPCRRRHDTKVGHSMQREHLHCAQPPSLLFAILFSRGNNFFLSNGFETDLEENFILILMIRYTVDCIEVILQIFFELFTYSLIHTHNHRRFTVCGIRKFFFRSVWKRKKEKRKKNRQPSESFRTNCNRSPATSGKHFQIRSERGRSTRDTRKRLEPVRDTVHHHERGTLWQQQA